MRKLKEICALAASIAVAFSATAQEADYTLMGHTTAPFSLNPSLVGDANMYRGGINYRMQWPTLENEYNTLRASFDCNIYKLISSVGVQYVYDNQSGDLKTHQVGLTYSHNIKIGNNEMYIRLGLSADVFIKKLGKDLLWGDQWQNGSVSGATLEQDNISDTKVFPDFSFGASFNMMINEDNLQAGAAIYHIGAPKYGFITDDAIELPRRLALHVRYIHDLNSQGGMWGDRTGDKSYIMGTLAFQHQDVYNMANINVGAFIKFVLFGVAYRHDFRKTVDTKLNTVSFMLGGAYKGLQAYYTYDLFTSRKKNGSWSHEFSVVYCFAAKHYRYSCPIVYW